MASGVGFRYNSVTSRSLSFILKGNFCISVSKVGSCLIHYYGYPMTVSSHQCNIWIRYYILEEVTNRQCHKKKLEWRLGFANVESSSATLQFFRPVGVKELPVGYQWKTEILSRHACWTFLDQKTRCARQINARQINTSNETKGHINGWVPMSLRWPSSVTAHSRIVVPSHREYRYKVNAGITATLHRLLHINYYIILPDAKATILVSDEGFGVWFWPPLLVIRAFKATRSIWVSIQGLVKTSCQPPASLNL